MVCVDCQSLPLLILGLTYSPPYKEIMDILYFLVFMFVVLFTCLFLLKLVSECGEEDVSQTSWHLRLCDILANEV